MTRGAGTMGKLIVLQRVREDAAREALARASEAEDRARAAERAADDRRRAAADAIATAGHEPPGAAAPAQVLQFRSRWRRQLEETFVALEQHFAQLQGERISAEQARERLRASWEASRKRREQLEERLRAARKDGRRRREQAAERVQDDLPPRGGGDG